MVVNVTQALLQAPSFDPDWFDQKIEHRPCHLHSDVTLPFQADPRCACQTTITWTKCSYDVYMKRKAARRLQEENDLLVKAKDIMLSRGIV
jgi:hypothetical protein